MFQIHFEVFYSFAKHFQRFGPCSHGVWVRFLMSRVVQIRPNRSKSVRTEQIGCRSVLGISQHSGPSVYRKATQTARNLTTWGIQIGREPFFGKFPYVPFPTQRYRGTWPFSRLPRSPHSNFNRSKRVRVSSLSEFCRHSYDFHEYRTRPGRNSHTMFVQKTFFTSVTLVYAISQSTRQS